MPNNEVALVMPEPGTLALLERDGQAARGYARESLVHSESPLSIRG